MKKVVKLTEKDLQRIVKKVLSEGEKHKLPYDSEFMEKGNYITEGVMWDRFRDKLHNLAINLKSVGYGFGKLPNIYRLKKSGDEEGYKKELYKIESFIQNQIDKHPRYERRGMLKKVMRDLKKLDDLSYEEFDKDPSKFNKHQQDMLMKYMKVTDSGIERDLDKYKLN